ncbi:MAG: CHAT domain-containing protein [Candidatus Nitrohelix vancouverensis]|uniref:CHAT domain-containing protein n=1 Tax=Candidatus Nitrohelix vancouverensis TaxID=2705534 RepID=A0A7T0C4U5_9BACT|nr:MAG: CHAT domain-containing protein [Candidatus Nitrohelix vancouverensis]
MSNYKRFKSVVSNASLLALALLVGLGANHAAAADSLFQSPVRVTMHPSQNFAPSISPDGRFMVYVSDRSGHLDLWWKSLEPGLQPPDRPLTLHSAEDNAPSISPDGKQLVFLSHRNDPRGDLFLLEIENKETEAGALVPVRLTDSSASESDPVWSADGKSIYFTSQVSGGLEKSIYKIDLATKSRVRVIQGEGVNPAPSPDGSRLVYVSSESNPHLLIANLETGATQALTQGSALDVSPRWTRSGNAVVFTRYEDDTNRDGKVTIDDNPNLWSLQVDGMQAGVMRQLTSSDSYDLLPQAGDDRVYYTAQKGSGVNIWSLPLEGRIRVSKDFEAAIAATRQTCMIPERRDYSCLMAYRNLIQTHESAPGLAEVRLEFAAAYIDLGHFDSGEAELNALLTENAEAQEYVRLAQIEQILLPLKRLQWTSAAGQEAAASQALGALNALSTQWKDLPRPSAQAALESGRLQALLNQPAEALEFYTKILKQYPEQKTIAAQAAFYQSSIFKMVGDRKSLIESYVGVVRDFYEVKQWRRKAIDEIIRLFETPQTLAEKIVNLQGLVEQYKALPPLAGAIQNRIGELYASDNELLLAKEAYRKTTAQFPDADEEVFVSRKAQAELYAREENFEKSIQIYEAIYDGSQQIQERLEIARKGRVEKALAKGTWEIRVGEIKLARKTFRKLIEFAPEVVEGHRGYVQAGAALQLLDATEKFYQERLSARPDSAIDRYALGLLATYHNPPDLKRAESEIGAALERDPSQLFFHQTLGWVYEQKERMLKASGSLERAVHEYEIALALNDENDKPENEADLYLNLGNTHYQLSNPTTAFYYYTLREDSAFPFYVKEREAIYRQRFGETAYKSGLLDSAIKQYRRAYELYEKENDAARLAELNDRMGLSYQDAGEYAKAVDAFSSALKLSRDLGNQQTISKTLRNIANNLYLLNEDKKETDPIALQTALGNYFEAVKLLEEHGTLRKDKKEKKGLIGISVETGLDSDASTAAMGFDEKGERKLIFHYVGKIYGDFGRYDLAIRYFEDKLKFIPADLDVEKNVPVVLEKALLLNQIGNYYYLWGKERKALEYFKSSFELSSALANRAGEAVNAINYARIALSLARTETPQSLETIVASAFDLLEASNQSLATSEALSHRRYSIHVKNHLGALHYFRALHSSGGGKAEAAIAFQSSLDAIDGSYREAQHAAEQFESAMTLAQTISAEKAQRVLRFNLDLARDLLGSKRQDKENVEASASDWQFLYVESLLKEGEERLALLEQAEQIASGLPRPLLPRDDASLALLEDVYQTLATLYFEAQQYGQALIISEKGRRLQMIALRPDLTFNDEAQAEYAEELNRIANAAFETSAQGRAIDDLLAEYAEFLEMTKADLPQLASLYAPTVPDLEEVRGLMKPEQSLIKLLMGRSHILVWRLSKDGGGGSRIPLTGELREAIERIGRNGEAPTPTDIALLSKAFIPALSDAGKTLILIADGPLEFLPWAALDHSGQALIASVDLVFVSSLEHFVRADEKKNLFNSRLLTVAYPGETAPQEDFFTVESLTKPESLYDRFMEEWAHFGVAHIGGPARFYGGTHGEIRLSSNPDQLQSIPVEELYLSPVHSSLLALSDARPQFNPYMSLSPTALSLQALTFKGYPGVVLASGGSDAEQAAFVWRGFYQQLRKLGPTAALRKAQMDAAEQFPESYAWAQYRYYGYPGMDEDEQIYFADEQFKKIATQGARAYQDADWLGAIDGFEKSLALSEYLPDDPLVPVLHQKLAEAAYNRGDYDKAIAYERRLIPIAEANKDALELARIERFIGVSYSRMEAYDDAVLHLKKAVEIFHAEKAPEEMAESYSQLGVVEENALNYAEALKAFQKSESIHESLKSELDRAKELRRIGRIYYLRLNQYREAEKYFEEARRVFAHADQPELTAETLLELGLVQEKQGAFAQALDYYARGRTIAETHELPLTLSRALLYQANSYWYQADYQSAFRLQREALKIAEAEDDAMQKTIIYNTLGLIHWTLNDSRRSLENLNRSLQLAQEIPSPTETASAYNNIGLVYRKDKKYQEAADYFLKALDYDLKSRSKWGQGYTHRNLGMTYLRMDRLDEAETHINEAVSLSRSINNQTNLVKSMLELGNLALKRKQWDAAVTHFESTAALAERLNIPEVFWRALRGQGFSLARLERTEDAIAAYRRATESIDAMRAAIKVEEFQNGFLVDKQEAYQELVLLLLDQGRVAESFEFVERSKSRSFIDLLGNQKISLKDDVGQKLFDQLQKQKQTIRDIEESVGEAHAQNNEALAASQAEQLITERNRYQDLLIEAKAESPQLSNFVTVDSIRLNELQALLEEPVALLEYLETPEELVIWVVTGKSIDAVRVPIQQQALRELIHDYRERIQKMAPVDEQTRQLYSHLIRPVESLIQTRRVLGIVPHGHLHYISFSSLHDGESYLFEKYPLFYSPSASVLEYTFKKDRARVNKGDIRVLAMGNPDLGDFNYDLPLSEMEVNAIKWDFPRVDVLTRERASESWVREHINEYQIIHIASHGEFDSVNPLFSSLKLTRDDAQDGSLEVNEVFSLKINADLVTLSGCQTGLGELSGGDDLVGLNRAFIYAGTHSLMSSLWRVSDISTAVLTKHFYRNYASNDKAESLRKAQLLVKSFYPHPAYWAAFSLTGDYR